MYKIKCICDIVCIIAYNQSVKIMHFERWRKNHLHHKYKGDWNYLNSNVVTHVTAWVACGLVASGLVANDMIFSSANVLKNS